MGVGVGVGVGVGTLGFDSFNYSLGGGVEVALGQTASLFVEAKGHCSFNGSCDAFTLVIGLYRHLGD